MKFRLHHVVFAVLVHLLLAAMLLTEVECSKPLEAPQVIQGVILDAPPKPQASQQAQKNVAREATPDEADAQSHEAQKQAEDTAAQEKAQQAAAAQARQQQQAEEEQRRQADAEAAKQAQILAQQKQAQEAQMKAQADAQKKAEAEAQAKAQAEAAQRKADADAKARAEKLQQQAAAEEAKRKADEEVKKRALDKAKHDADERKQREKELASAIGSELSQAQIGAEQATWGTAVTEAIRRAWRRPPGVDSSTSCVVNIRLLANGQVINASMKRPSGNGLFDDSVIAAVYKASPLPLPEHNEAFESSINVTFTP